MSMQHCHIAQWHDGLMRFGKTGMPFRTTSVQDDPTWRTTQTPCFPVACWSLMDCAWVNSGSRSMSQNCAPHSARHSGLPQTCSALDTPWNFQSVTKAPLCSHWTGTKGKMATFLGESSLWTKPGLAHMNQTRNANQINGSISVLLFQKSAPYSFSVNVIFIVAYGTAGVILYCATLYTSKAVYYCTLLQHNFHPTLRRKRLYLVVQNPIILHDNARNHTVAAVTDLLLRWQ